jgi:hypothetical protein
MRLCEESPATLVYSSARAAQHQGLDAIVLSLPKLATIRQVLIGEIVDLVECVDSHRKTHKRDRDVIHCATAIPRRRRKSVRSDVWRQVHATEILYRVRLVNDHTREVSTQ